MASQERERERPHERQEPGKFEVRAKFEESGTRVSSLKASFSSRCLSAKMWLDVGSPDAPVADDARARKMSACACRRAPLKPW